MNIKTSLQSAAKKLLDKKITSARLDAEVILCFVLNKDKTFLYTYPEKKLTKKQSIDFTRLITKRAAHFPVAYITNKKEFFGLNFYVDKNVLIPRPETELLVGEALALIKDNKITQVADIGTGSGCIAVSIAKNCRQARILAADISSRALRVAKLNAKRHGLSRRIKIFQGNLLEPLKNKKVDIIMANLPYLKANLKKMFKFPNSKSLQYEPKIALRGGGRQGLSLCRELLVQAAAAKFPPKFILLEIGIGQARGLKKIARQFWPRAETRIMKDLADRDRLLIIKTHF